jgi:hypothetical protein
MNYENALKVLEEGTAILRKCGIRNWLSAGTALGAYRDGFSKEFVERDTDIDVGVYSSDPEKDYWMIHENFVAAGYTLVRTYKGNWNWTQLAMQKDGIWFDIYFFYKEGGTLCSYTDNGIMKKPLDMIVKMDTVTINGNPYNVPGPIEDYLVLRYGPNWRVPPASKVPWGEECANLTNKGQVNISNMRCGI